MRPHPERSLPVNDQKIIELLFERSESVLGNIEEIYGRLCHHIAMNILSSSSDAEECVNDAYFKIWNTIPPQRPESFKAYLLKTVKNISLNRAKYNLADKRMSNFAVSADELEGILSDSSDLPFGISERNRLGEEINKFLDTLDETSRILFVRRYWYGDSLSYLAEITGYNENNISQKLFTVRSKLKKHLSKGGFYI